MNETGWFAEFDDRPRHKRWPWHPVLMLQGGCSAPVEAWFATEEECEEFIIDEVIGQGLLE